MLTKLQVLLFTLLVCTVSYADTDIVLDNQTIDSNHVESIYIIPTSGDIVVNIKDDWGVTLFQEEDDSGSAPVNITSFVANKTSMVTGTSVTFNWATTNASSCDAQGGTGNWPNITPSIPNGNHTMTLNTAGNYTFTLQCTDLEANLSTRNINVAVTTAPVTPPPGGVTCQAPSMSGQTKSWTTVFGTAFPGPKSAQVLQQVMKGGYLAIQFNTGSAVDWGGLSTIETTNNAGTRYGAVSACKGRFDVASECDHAWGISSGITWSTNNKSGSCKLLPNTTYYFNISFVNPNTGGDTCNASNCYTEVRVSNPD